MCADLAATQELTDLDLAHFCYHVDLEQSWEIAGMRSWLQQQGLGPGMRCGGHAMGCGNLNCDSSKAFLAANMKTHRAMAVRYSCDAGLDFVQGMIPHHQGAVDMCAVLLASTGRSGDAFLQALCHNITRLQNSEMAWMR